MMKKLLLLFALILCSNIQISAQQTPLTSSYFRNKFLYNPAYTANQIAPRVDALYRQQWTGIDGGISTTTLTAQMPRLIRRDSTGTAKPILANGLGANFLLTKRNNFILSTTGFQLGATKSFYNVMQKDSLGNLSSGATPFPISIGFGLGGYMTSVDNSRVIGQAGDEVLTRYGNAQFKPDAVLGITYAKKGLKLGFAMRQLFARSGKGFSKYFNQTFFTGSYYAVLGTLDRVGIEPQIVIKGNQTSAQLQFNLVADFWRDWEKGTPRMQTVIGYRTGFGFNAGITVRPLPRLAVSYMYEMTMNKLNRISKGVVGGENGSLGLTHEIMLTYDLRHEKWSPRPIIELPNAGGSVTNNIDTGGVAQSISSIELEGVVYKKGDLINDFLGQVLFEPGTAELKDESYLALDKLAEMMLINKAVRIEVGSHTDSLSNQFSLQLTQKRSDAIKSYLQDVKGVELGRIVPIGFGRTRQEEGKEPERTEFKLIAINEDDDE